MKLKLILLLVLIFGSITGIHAQNRKKPNVILILADDLGWGVTSIQMDADVPASASDYMRTPNLRRLAQRSIIFSQGYAPHPNCSPSRASILTGKSPAQLKLTDIIHRNGGPLYQGNFLTPPKHINQLPDSELTIAQWINKYRPEYQSALYGKWHLANGGPRQHGFDDGDGPTTNREGNNNSPDNPKKTFGITRRGMQFMDKQVKDDKPFFLELAYYAIHKKIEYKPSTLQEVNTWPKGKRHTNAEIAAMTKDLDTGIGMILDKVKELGIEDNTYIIFTSDNGSIPSNNPGNLNGPVHGWKATLWEGGIRVPFVVSGPGIQHGRRTQPVVGYDIFPTICDWLDINSLPKGVEGGSIRNALASRQGTVNRPQDFLAFHFPHYQLQKASHPVSAIVKGSYKMLKFYETGNEYLYNLDEDLAETEDIEVQHPQKAQEMDALLNSYLKDIGASLPVINPNYTPKNDPGKKFRKRKLKLMEMPYFIIK